MYKNVVHKVFSMLLAFLVLLSTFSFKVETHFCGSNLVDVAVFSKAKSCCDSAVKMDSELQFTKESCCTNKVVSVEGLNQFKVISLTKDLPIQDSFELPSKFSLEWLVLEDSVASHPPNYSPPDLIMDHQIDYQIFLI
ncbi:MAG: hypothetical protein P8O96_01125 [Flavobacteriaceae bacterium]|jgi:hypothetical protein|nr:hypothetical protein [Flavobacteriaceae bacterium]MDG1041431.1 hypothetical protein [Flavobacteriaceae bacterium]MDG1794245.1 hypothetical protein [Flavobacteriaceae bacterium]